MSKPSKTIAEIAPMLTGVFSPEQISTALDAAAGEYSRLCLENQAESKAVKTHTQGEIYPCIALYRGLLAAGIEAREAVAFLDRSWSRRAEPKAESIRTMMKLPGLYRLMPRIFRLVTKQSFGAKAGFAATFYPTGPDRCKFDMTRCLYCDVCRKNGCPELVPCFCHTDDVTDGNMHPKLIWNRTKIMGDGADCCDFDLYIQK